MLLRQIRRIDKETTNRTTEVLTSCTSRRQNSRRHTFHIHTRYNLTGNTGRTSNLDEVTDENRRGITRVNEEQFKLSVVRSATQMPNRDKTLRCINVSHILSPI